MRQKVIIIGAGGQARVIADMLIKNNDILIGFLDDNIPKDTLILENYKVIGKIEEASKLYQKDGKLKFVIAIGDNSIRKEMSQKYKLPYYTIIHPNAVIGKDVTIDDGTVIMANATINIGVKIGKHCIINTGAVIEHDCELKDFVHISPTATLSGSVKIAELVHVGTGSKIRNNININAKCILGVGSVIVKDINHTGIYVGIPARKIKDL